MKYDKKQRLILSSVLFVTVTVNLLIYPQLTSAHMGSGQLTFSRQVMIGGNNAISGQTVFNGSRIKVGNAGSAIVTLGKQGRLELGANAEMVLLLADKGKGIGGILTSGCLAINVSAGEQVKIDIPKGTVSSSGDQHSFFILEVNGDTTSVFPNLGEIKVSSGREIETARPGDVITLKAEANGKNTLRRFPRSELSGLGAACDCDRVSASYAGASSQSENRGKTGYNGLLGLLFFAVEGTRAIIFGLTAGSSGANPSTYGSGLTCVNTDGLFCKPAGPITP